MVFFSQQRDWRILNNKAKLVYFHAATTETEEYSNVSTNAYINPETEALNWIKIEHRILEMGAKTRGTRFQITCGQSKV